MEHINAAAVPIYFILVYAGLGIGLFSFGPDKQGQDLGRSHWGDREHRDTSQPAEDYGASLRRPG